MTLRENIVLPADEAKERALLGAMIEREDIFCELCQQLTAQDFNNPTLAKVFDVIMDFYRQDRLIDHRELIARCEAIRLVDAAGLIMTLANEYYVGMQYSDHADDLQNLTAKRQLIRQCQKTIMEACDPQQEAEEISTSAIQAFYKIQSGTAFKEVSSVKAILSDFSEGRTFEQNLEWMLDRRSQKLPPYEGVPSRYPLLDQTLGYFKKGGLYYIGARTSMGKTTFMLNLIANQLLPEAIPIGIFSLEMSAAQITGKLLCICSDVKYWKYEDARISSDNHNTLIMNAKRFNDLPIYIHDPSSIKIGQLCVMAKKMVEQYGIKILYIDYLTRIKGSSAQNSKHLEVNEISKALQSLAKELEIPIVCLAQLNRNAAGRLDTTPTLSDFRESGSIEEDCDAAILLHRPEYYNPNVGVGIVQVIVAKNRFRGIVRKLDFNCVKDVSERYHEYEELKKP